MHELKKAIAEAVRQGEFERGRIDPALWAAIKNLREVYQAVKDKL